MKSSPLSTASSIAGDAARPPDIIREMRIRDVKIESRCFVFIGLEKKDEMSFLDVMFFKAESTWRRDKAVR